MNPSLTNVRQHEGRPVTVLPEHDPPHPSPSHVGGVVLSPHEAVLHHLVARGPHTVPVGSPGEDLDPADDVVRVVGLVASGEIDGVGGGVGYSDSLYGHVVRV